MANPYRGEVTLTIDGEPHTLRLTLGALAALEARLEAGSLKDLVERFEGGGFSARDIVALLAAGLPSMTEEDLLQADIAGGPMEAARVAARLLTLTFAVPGGGD